MVSLGKGGGRKAEFCKAEVFRVGDEIKKFGRMTCKISGKIEFSHHGFVMAFLYAESKEEAPHVVGREITIVRFLNSSIMFDLPQIEIMLELLILY